MSADPQDPGAPSGPVTVIVGIGNTDRGDDAIGRLLARQLRHSTSATVIECGGEPAALLDALGQADRAYIVDAAEFGAPPGTVLRLDAAKAPLPAFAGAASTHGLGLADAIELGRALGGLPPCCVVYAVQGQSYVAGAALSAPACAALAEVERRILAELRAG